MYGAPVGAKYGIGGFYGKKSIYGNGSCDCKETCCKEADHCDCKETGCEEADHCDCKETCCKEADNGGCKETGGEENDFCKEVQYAGNGNGETSGGTLSESRFGSEEGCVGVAPWK